MAGHMANVLSEIRLSAKSSWVCYKLIICLTILSTTLLQSRFSSSSMGIEGHGFDSYGHLINSATNEHQPDHSYVEAYNLSGSNEGHKTIFLFTTTVYIEWDELNLLQQTFYRFALLLGVFLTSWVLSRPLHECMRQNSQTQPTTVFLRRPFPDMGMSVCIHPSII